MMQKETVKAQSVKQDEMILVVRREHLMQKNGWHGLRATDLEKYRAIIKDKQEFHPRSLMEVDPTYKQIIPYLVFMHDNKYFLMQRSGDASEKRLRNKYSLGIGGHIRQEDMTTGSIFDWARREFHEEVSYVGNIEISSLGLLNDDSNDVGKVHIGLVLLLQGDSADITVRSELKSGQLCSLDELSVYQERMESWSQIITDALRAV